MALRINSFIEGVWGFDWRSGFNLFINRARWFNGWLSFGRVQCVMRFAIVWNARDDFMKADVG